MSLRALTTALCLALIWGSVLSGCSATRVETTPAGLGKPVSEAEMIAALEASGSIVFTKHTAARWAVPLSGLLNLNHAKAVSVGLEDVDEAIELYVYSLQHPTKGTFIVDSGISESLRNPGANRDISTLVKMAMKTDRLVTQKSTDQLMREYKRIDGVLLTHLHLDHILGLNDIATSVPVFVGPGDAAMTELTHVVTQGTTDRLLRNVEILREWSFHKGQILDVFEDGSLFAISAPGHTPGTTVYLANSTDGPQLMIGDVTHTGWGWEQGVEPGTYSHDPAESAEALAFIKRLASKITGVTVHPGHQSLADSER